MIKDLTCRSLAVPALPAFVIIAMLLFIGTLQAAPYNGESFTYKQPDGEAFTVRLWGDEFFAYQETEEGYLVVRDPRTGMFCYAKVSPDGSDIVSTGVRVGKAKPAGLKPKQRLAKGKAFEKSLGRRALLGADDRGRRTAARIRAAQKDPFVAETQTPDETDSAKEPLPSPPLTLAQPAPPSTITVNTRVGLVMLASFPDAQGEVNRTPAQVETYFNAPTYTTDGNATSVYGYFQIQSDGKLSYTNIVTAWFVAANNKAYYTDRNASGRAQELVLEGLAILDGNGFDFSQCDGNGDGELDGLNVFYAGATVNAWAEGLWPHAGGFHWNPILTKGFSSTLIRYQMTDMPAKLGIGTTCHENGHMICRFPDLYSYDGNAAGTGPFSLMGGGNSFHPSHVDPYLKMHAGWITTTDVTLSGETNHTLTVDGTNVIRYVNPNNPMEYFLFEMRGEVGYEGPYGGATGEVCPSKGLVVYHAREDGTNTRSSIFTADNPNCDYSTPPELLVIEDNPKTTINPWYDDPTTDGNDAFDTGDEVNNSTTPTLSFWSSDGRTIDSGIGIGNIVVGTSSLTFSIFNGNPPLITATPRVVPAGGSTSLSVEAPGMASYSWTKVSGPGAVTFGSPNAIVTTATFDSALGTYVLRVTMSDGSSQVASEISIQVTAGLDEYVGHYKHLPVQNTWHEGWVEFSGPQLQWRNTAGADWNLNTTAEPDTFVTDSTCPYGAGIEIPFSRENGQVVLFMFNGGIYRRCTPVADNQSVGTVINTSVGVILTAWDAEDEPITSYSVATGPTHGTLSGTAPNLTYTPDTDYFGGDCFTFTATDGTYTSNVATVSIDVSTIPEVITGTYAPVTLSSGAPPPATSGADIFLDAGQDDGANATWEDTLGAWNLTLDTLSAVTFVADAGSALPGITSAYDFPGGASGSGGALGTSLGSMSGWDSTPVTIEMWFKPNSTGDDGLANGQVLFETGGGTGLGIFYNDGTIEVGHDTAEVISTVDVSSLAGDFIQVVLTYDMKGTNQFIIYVNGSQAGTGNRADTDWSGTDGAGLGARGGSNVGGRGNGDSSTASFNGQVSVFRAYQNQVLTAAEVVANYESIAGNTTATVDLDGTVTDEDGDRLTTTWSLVSTVPAGLNVSFGDDEAVDTTVTFRAAGRYTLRLTADDGVSQPYAEVEIIVNPSESSIADVNLPAGISLYGYTGQNPVDAQAAFQTLIDNTQLSLVRWVNPATGSIKELYYTTFPSAGWVNEIGNLTLGQGYVVKITAACTLSISGNKDTGSIIWDLPAGYSIIGFNREAPLDAQTAFQTLVDSGKLEIVRWVDPSNGAIKELYFTTFPSAAWVNEIGNLTEGQGYIIKLNAPHAGFSLP